MVNRLLDIAKKITDSYKHSSAVPYPVFEQYLKEFSTELNQTTDPHCIIDIIRHNEENMLIPFDLIKEMYLRLITIGERTPYVLRWYASMLASYSDEFNNPDVDLLLTEADKLENRE